MTVAEARQVLVDIPFPTTQEEVALVKQALQVLAGAFARIPS